MPQQDDMPKRRTVRAFSAGGIVFRTFPSSLSPDNDASSQKAPRGVSRIEIVLVGRAWEKFWVLPKGTPEQGETHEQVALREVAEESGIRARILEEVGSTQYWFSRQGVRYNKEVLYYLMEAVGGDVTQHDHEYDDARWFPINEASSILTYVNEAELVRRAKQRIARYLETEQPS